MDLIQTLILALIQGVTEWLPISSSGHLVIMQEYFGLAPPVIFDVLLHVGTLLVVFIVFWKDIADITRAVARLDFGAKEGKIALYIAAGNVPTVMIGFIFHEIFESFFHSLLAVGVALLGTGCILYFSKYGKNGKGINCLTAFLMGTAQGIALIPGVSRSGVTIATGLLSKLQKEMAFKFSFLLSIPAVIGAAVAEFALAESKNLFLEELNGFTMTVGIVVSMIVGYTALKLLQRLVFGEKLHLFAYYCWIVGTAVIILTI